MRTQKRCNRGRWFHGLDSELSDKTRKKHRKQCRVYTDFFAQRLKVWQKEPTAEWKKEQLSHWCKVDYQKNGGTVRRNAIVTCSTGTTRWPMARQHARTDVARSLTDHQFPSEHWLSTSQLPCKTSQEYISLGKRNMFKLCSTCRVLVGQVTLEHGRLWRCTRIRSLRHPRQKFQKPRDVRKRRLRISVCTRKSKTSKAFTTIIDSGGKPRARRWCWNRRTRQKGKQKWRFVVHEWRTFLSTSWRTSFEASRPREWNTPDPIEIRRRNETNSDEYEQCLWTSYQWHVDRSERCPSFWGVECDCKIPDPT